jgi:hypothetical protein
MNEPLVDLHDCPLIPGPFGDLLVDPYESSLGGDAPDAVNTRGISVRLGTRPLAFNLLELYGMGHDKPPTCVAYDAYKLWLVVHSVGVIHSPGSPEIRAVGYEADFQNEASVYTVGLFPDTQFETQRSSSLAYKVLLGADGTGEAGVAVPGVLGRVIKLGGGVELRAVAQAELLGELQFSVTTTAVQSSGITAARAEWQFRPAGHPVAGDQVMVQTLLTPQSVETLKFRIRARLHLRSRFFGFPATYLTEWNDVEALCLNAC